MRRVLIGAILGAIAVLAFQASESLVTTGHARVYGSYEPSPGWSTEQFEDWHRRSMQARSAYGKLRAEAEGVDLSRVDFYRFAHGYSLVDYVNGRVVRATPNGIYLEGISFAGAILTGVDFRGACLSDVNLTGADLRYANLSGTRGEGHLGCREPAPARFTGARYDASTRLPPGLASSTAGMVYIGE